MDDKRLNRRDFNRLTAAALGGAAIGTGLDLGSTYAADGDVHVCKGLNACKGKGADGKNDCAGMGKCATAKAHKCGGHNDCKGQGGCGSTPGQNDCKGNGKCAVPLSKKAWKKARSAFEKSMKDAGKKAGAAPK